MGSLINKVASQHENLLKVRTQLQALPAKFWEHLQSNFRTEKKKLKLMRYNFMQSKTFFFI